MNIDYNYIKADLPANFSHSILSEDKDELKFGVNINEKDAAEVYFFCKVLYFYIHSSHRAKNPDIFISYNPIVISYELFIYCNLLLL